MARNSPSVRRVTSILSLLSEHPGQAFTLTDFVRTLRLNVATCHSLLNSLVEAGYLYRARDKSYVPGPALIALGRMAEKHSSPLQVAQPEMRALANEYDVICSANFLERNEVVIRARAASLSHLDVSLPTGTRMLLRPPFAAVHFAWSTPAEASRWLDQADPPATASQRKEMEAGMTFAREHGFCFGVHNQSFETPWDSPELMYSRDRTRFALSLQRELDPEENYDLAFISAPVFENATTVAFVLSLFGFDKQKKGAAIEAMGRTLRKACDRISAYASGGIIPAASD